MNNFSNARNATIGAVAVDPHGQNKLSAAIVVTSTEPVKYSYTVLGRSPDTDFTFSSDIFSSAFTVPVIGLYANTTTYVVLVFENQQGVQEQTIVPVSTVGQDYGQTALQIAIERSDEAAAAATIDRGWLITSWFSGYDKNGDLRMAGMFPWSMQPLKTFAGVLYAGDDVATLAATVYRQTNLLGETGVAYTAPEGLAFHHDITFDNSGHLYTLATAADEVGTDEQKLGGILCKYEIATGELLWQRDYSPEFMGQDILQNGGTNDIHWNTLEYLPTRNEIILNSRATSTIVGADAENGDFVWMIDNPVNQRVLDPEKNMQVITENFQYPNGEHTSFYTNNPKYAAYQTGNRICLSVFNNNSCRNDDGSDNTRVMEEPAPSEVYRAPLDADVYILGLDFDEFTVELLDVLTLPAGERSEFAGNAWEIGDYYGVYNWQTKNFFIVNTDSETGVSCYAIDPIDGYRARIFTYEELRELL